MNNLMLREVNLVNRILKNDREAVINDKSNITVCKKRKRQELAIKNKNYLDNQKRYSNSVKIILIQTRNLN
jgi:hypothetical protein